MRIACLGWGSLVWNPSALPIRREWFKDGPFAPVEFTRRSSDSRVTLVVDPEATPVRLLWAHMIPTDLSVARAALRDREGIPGPNWLSKIGKWERGVDSAPAHIPDLPKWADVHALDAAVWTALEPTFREKDKNKTLKEVIDYLRSLTGPERAHAKEYVERAPRQIDTDYRRHIEATMGWLCSDDIR